MFWIIETNTQIDRFLANDMSSIFVEPIPHNDYYHPTLSNIICLYIRVLSTKESFIVSFTHSEGLKEIDFMDFILRLSKKCSQIYVSNKKKVMGWLPKEVPVKCLKMGYYLINKDIPDPSAFNTKAHHFFYGKYPYKDNINSIIPLAKHYEKYENYLSSVVIDNELFNSKVYDYYDKNVINAFHYVENQGLKIDSSLFDIHYKPKHKPLSVLQDVVYTEYNLFTQTGRPSNSFNGINFAALKKDTGERSTFISEGDFLVEFDYKSYHPRILAHLVGYDFKDDDVYDHIAKLYHGSEVITQEQREDIKSLIFMFLYTDSMPSDLIDIDYFKKVKELKEFLWESYNKKGYITSPITKRRIYNIDSKVKILPYLCQTIETERNAEVLRKINEKLLLCDTKAILYTYDSFLFDFSKSDGKTLLNDLQDIIEATSDGYVYPTNIKYGKNYGNLH